jgi:cytochrome d ubiquinol oxidase subunit II
MVLAFYRYSYTRVSRGIAFEFRFRDAEHRTFWDHGFFYGSVVATVAQGVMLGAFIQSFRVEGRVFVGTAFDFLTPFSILTGIALVFGYGLLGAGWLVLKTEGEIQERARRYGRLWLAGVLVALLPREALSPTHAPSRRFRRP